MTEINLLRWHLSDSRWMQKKLNYGVGVVSLLIIVFLIIHCCLSYVNYCAEHEKGHLQDSIASTHSDQLQTHFTVEEMGALQVSQNHLWQVVNLLNCLLQQQIQITKIVSKEKQTQLTGYVESPSVLSNALAFCLPEKTAISVTKLIFNYQDKLKLLQFSFFI